MFIYLNRKIHKKAIDDKFSSGLFCREQIGKETDFYYKPDKMTAVWQDKAYFVYYSGIPAASAQSLKKLIAAYDAASDKDSFRLSKGSYLILIYDKSARSINIYRDAWSTAPVYYFKDGSIISDTISEIASVLKERRLNENVIAEYLASSYIVGSPTLYEDIFSLVPLYMLKGADSNISVSRNHYYPGIDRNISADEVKNRLTDILDLSIKDMASSLDDPEELFVSLSGGTDSSLLVSKIMEVYKKPSFKCGVVEYKDWHRNDTLYYSKVVDKYSLKKFIKQIDNDIYKNAFISLANISLYAYHTFSPSIYALLSSAKRESPELSYHVNGTGPDEAVIGFEKVPLGQMRIYDTLPKSKWVDTLFSEIDYLYTPAETVKQCLREGLAAGILEQRHQIASRIADESEMFSEFQRRYAMQTITDHHIRMLYHISELCGLHIVFPYCRQEFFELCFAVPYYTLNIEKSYKHVFKMILSRYFDDEFVFRQKIGFHAPSRGYFRTKGGMGALLAEINIDSMKNLFSVPEVKDQISIRLNKDNAPMDYLLWTITNIGTLSQILNKR